MALRGHINGFDQHSQNLMYLLSWQIHWCGFVGRGADLVRAGWKTSLLNNHHNDSAEIVFENDSQQVKLISNHFYIRDLLGELSGPGHLSLGLRYCAREFVLQGISPIAIPIDLSPQEFSGYDLQKIRFGAMSPFKSFIAPEPQRIIVPQELNVDEMLKAILDKQQPAQVEYFNKQVAENKIPNSRLTAQIIQLRA